MCRRATVTPIACAFVCCDSIIWTLCALCILCVLRVCGVLYAEFLRIPRQAELAGRRHVSDERRRSHNRRTGQVAFAAEPHAVLPVPVERRDRAFALLERVRALSEAGAAPRLANLTADGPEHIRNRLPAQPCVGPLDFFRHAAGPRKDHEFSGRVVGALTTGGTDDERRGQQIVVAAVRTRSDQRLVECQPLPRD